MDCQAIMAEVAGNNQKVKDLAADEGIKVAQNVAAGAAGFLIPVLWFGMDFQGTASKEIAALQSRQQYMVVLAEQRNCGASAADQPVSPPHKAKKALWNRGSPYGASGKSALSWLTAHSQSPG